ncbi:MAG TPA: PKD domain-containing protein [Cyclobacteriaceae bacterium]
MSRSYIYSLTCLFITCLAGSLSLHGQNYSSHNWYFGNSPLGIRFSRGDNSASLYTNQATPFGNGGGAVASDPTNGNILFYTDGSRVYDVTGAQMPNGFGLNVNTSGNQSVATSAKPGQPDQYYIFTNTADFTTGGIIAVTTVDMTQLGNATPPTPALGNVTGPKNIPIAGLANRSEAMTLIPHENGTDYWLITHENGTSNYAVTLIDASGTFPTTVYTNVGFSMTAGNFSYNAATGQIAVSPQSANVDVHILSFDNDTGMLTFDQTIPNTGVDSTNDLAIYDVEWSNNGQYLYISVAGEAGIPADVLQYDLLNPGNTLASVLPQPNSIAQSYGLQMGPDSTIYHLYQETPGGEYLLGALTNTDTVASEVVYDPVAFPGNFLGTQFPSFLPSMDQTITIDFTSSGTCANSPTSFFPTVSPDADSLVWNFGDGTGSSDWSPNHIYENGGTYDVTVTAYLNGQSESVTHPVTITQFDLQLTLVQDTTACRDEFPPPRGTGSPQPFSVTAQVQGGSPVSEEWSNGDTGLTLTPDSAGFYYIVVTDATGCSAYAGVNVREYELQDQRANIWYFGQNAGIDFNPLPDNPPVAITGPVNSPEGTATISDRNGEVIFSTDGIHIYDKDNNDITPAPNPPGLGGEPGATQSVLIMPVPGDETLYYIFTTQEVYGTGTYELRYSLFDLKLNNGDGGLVEYNVLLYTPTTERITGSGEWLIAHDYGNNSFRAYRIGPDGISNPVISGVGTDHGVTSPENGQGYMKLGPGNKLAVALSTPGTSNVIEIFDFNDSTGMVTNPQIADLENPNGQVYGIEFSPGGNKLFATLTGSPSELYEFAFDSLGNVYFKQSVSQPEELGALQIGPDGQIYMAVNGSTSLYTILAVEDTAALSPLNTLQPFPLAGGSQSTLGLPNFIQNISSPIQGPTISASGTCLGSPTDFNATGRDPNIEFFSWNFGDGQGTSASTDPAAQHQYANPGTYNVALTLSNRCDMDTVLFTTVVITAPPDDPTFLQPGEFPVLCDGPLTLEATPASNPDLDDLIFVWSTGDSTRTIEVNQQATYSVTIIDAAGCSSDGSILVADNRPIVELGPDLTICQNTAIMALDAQNPGANYQWQINGANAGTARTQSVDTSIPGLYEYRVSVTDPITTCTVTDSLTYTINESPAFAATPFNTTTCGADDGRIELNISAPATSVFTWSVTGPSPGVSAVDQPANPLPAAAYVASPLGPGTYGITVTDQVSGCFAITTAAINDDAFTVAGVVNGTCDPIVIDVTTAPAQGAVDYRVIDDATGVEVDAGSAASGTFSTNPLPSNNRNYIVEVTSTGPGCTSSSLPILVDQNAEVAVTISSDPCSDPISISVTGGTSWAWTGPNIVGAADGSSITATPPQGTQVFNLTVNEAGFCQLDTAITVMVDNAIVPTLTQSDACSDQVILTATPSGPYLYRWYRNGVLDNTLGGTQAIATDANDGQQYMVQVFNPVTGCTGDSPTLNVSVIGLLELTLDVSQACEGEPFTITGTTNQPVASYQWSYEGSIINGETSSTLVDTRAGTFEALVSEAGCTAVEEISVLLAPNTPGSLNAHALICNDPDNTDPATSQVLLDPGAGFTSYTWFRDGVALGVSDPTLIVTEPGTYTVELVNSFGCSSSDQTVVEVECLPKIVVPNAFRPKGLNSEFFAYTFFIDDTDFEVLIFSRWGELIFQSTDRLFHWNGGYNNSLSKPLPPGTYAYLIKYKSTYQPERGVQEKRGGVVLLR